MLNIVDKKYAELSGVLDKMHFIPKRNLSIYSMARTVSLLKIFQKTDELKELLLFEKAFQDICSSIVNNISLNTEEYRNICERLSDVASNQTNYEGLNVIEQIVCDRSYMFLENWFYFLQIDFINGEDESTDFARFILFPAELIKEMVSSLNHGKKDDEIQNKINENVQMLIEMEVLEEEMKNLNNVIEEFEINISKNLKYNLLEGLTEQCH